MKVGDVVVITCTRYTLPPCGTVGVLVRRHNFHKDYWLMRMFMPAGKSGRLEWFVHTNRMEVLDEDR